MKLDFFIHATPIEIRKDQDRTVVRGLAIPYNRSSKPICGMFVERFAPGSIRTLKDVEAEVYAYVEHDSDKALARRSNGSLKLIDSNEGCYAEATLNNTTYALDLAENIRTGVIKGMSFGFRAIVDEWDNNDEKMAVRTVKDAELYEVTFTHNPAYPSTNASLRSNYMNLDEVLQLAKSKIVELPKKPQVANAIGIVEAMRIRGV